MKYYARLIGLEMMPRAKNEIRKHESYSKERNFGVLDNESNSHS